MCLGTEMNPLDKAKFTTMGSCNCADGKEMVHCHRYASNLEDRVDDTLSMTHLYALTASGANVIVSCLNNMRGYIQEKVTVTLLLPWTH